jgi:hypothetical protein
VSPLEQGVAVGLGMAIIGTISGICMRSAARPASVGGKLVYKIHPVWFVFSALGGIFLSGIFVMGASFQPDLRTFCLGSAAVSAAFFCGFALLMRSLSVTIDETSVTGGNLFGRKSVEFRNVEKVTLAGFVVEVRQKPDPATGKRPRPLIFLAGFRGIKELMATIRTRSGIEA